MKLPVLAVFMSGSISVAAFVPFYARIVVPEILETTVPAKGLPPGQRDFPIPERSVVAVKLVLPVSALSRKANHCIPPVLTGTKHKNFHPKITKGVIDWKMRPGTAKIRNTGKGLDFHLPISGQALARGDYGLGILNIGVRGKSNMAGHIEGRIKPHLTHDWRVKIPNPRPRTVIKRAQIKVAGISMSDARTKIQNCLNDTVRLQAKSIEPCLNKALHLKQGINKIWNQAHIYHLLDQSPQPWVVFDPAMIEAGPIDYSVPDVFSLTVGIVAESFVSNTEPSYRAPEALPDLQLKDSDPVTDIRIPIILNYRTLNHTLAQRTFVAGPETGISSVHVKAGHGGFVNLGMKVGKLDSWLSACVSVRARPVIDCVSQTLGFTDVSIAVDDSDPLKKTTGWLVDRILIRAVESQLRIDLKRYLPTVESEIVKVVNSAPVPDQFELRLEKPKVKLIGAYTVKQNSWNEPDTPGIVLVAGATGDITVRVKEL